jgi:radical SAM protein with 4Fe4S-binding SPASM domain
MTEPVLGNVREERLKFIWQNSRALKEIRSFKNMKMSDIQCEKETCRYSSNCFPGCRAISQRLTGSHYKTDPFWCLNTQRLPGAHQDA